MKAAKLPLDKKQKYHAIKTKYTNACTYFIHLDIHQTFKKFEYLFFNLYNPIIDIHLSFKATLSFYEI